MTAKKKTPGFFQSHKLAKIIVLSFISITVLAVFFVRREYANNPSYLSGDEPHYIMMTDSLVKDRDFDLKNDYEERRADDYYLVPDLYPHVSPIFTEESPHWYSIHTTGLSFILYIPFALFGVIGARIWMIIIQLASVLFLYLILKKYTKSPVKPWLGVSLILTTSLFWQNIGSIFPDLLITSLWGGAILLFDKDDWKADLGFAAIVVLAGLVHSKGVVLLAPLLAAKFLWGIYSLGLYEWLKRYKLTVVFLTISAAAYVRYLHQRYGVLSPSQIYGSNGQLFSANPIVNGTAMITDRSKGLLVYFPALFIAALYYYRAVVNIVRTAISIVRKKIKPNRNHFLLAGVITGLVAILITQAGFQDWSGSTAPNGRGVLPFVFVTTFVITYFASMRTRLEKFILISVIIVGAILSLYSILDFKYYMSPGVNSFWVDRHSFLDYLPLFDMTAAKSGTPPIVRGSKVMLIVLVFNAGLAFLYNYKIKLKKRAP